MTKEQGKHSRFLQTAIRLLFAIVIVGGLVWFRKDQLKQCLESFNYLFVAPAMLFYFLTNGIAAWRWRKLAQMQNFELSMFEAFSLTMQGNFFSLIIPGGAIGGDVVKMGLLAKRRRPGTRGEGIFTIFMDRVVGMLALFLLAIVWLVICFPEISVMKTPYIPLNAFQLKLIVLGVILMCLAGIAAGIAIFFHRFLRRIPGVGSLMDFCDRRFNQLVSRVCAMADQYAQYPGVLTVLVAISVFFIHMFSAIPLCFLIAGTGCELNLPQLIMIMTAVTMGNIAGLIPLTPGGIGLRDLTVIAILSAGNISQGTGETAQLMSTGLSVIFNLCGGLFFVFDPGRTSSIGAKK